MARGKASTIGAERWSPNGYHYTRTPDGWELTHRLVAAEKLGRPLTEEERIRFVDGDRTNLKPTNINVYIVKKGTILKRISVLEAKKEAIDFEIAELKAQLEAS